ncbi:MAG: Fic family protein [Nocardioides sp.]
MAVAHYQFEAIHPFHDGNGRTGRVINILMLIQEGLLAEPILYLSRAIIARKNDYYRLLRVVTAEDAWVEWILYMLEIVRDSATSTTRKIGAIRVCQEDIVDRARAATPGGRDRSSWLSPSSSPTVASTPWPTGATSRGRPLRHGSMRLSRPGFSVASK